MANVQWKSVSGHDFKITFDSANDADKFQPKHSLVKRLEALTRGMAGFPNGDKSVFVTVMHPEKDFCLNLLEKELEDFYSSKDG